MFMSSHNHCFSSFVNLLLLAVLHIIWLAAFVNLHKHWHKEEMKTGPSPCHVKELNLSQARTDGSEWKSI